MSFFKDVLRVGGVLVAPVLIASGVGAPLGLAVGAVAAGAGNAAADAIDRSEQEKQNDQKAAEAKLRSDQEIERRKQEEKAREAEVVKQLRQKELPGKVIQACQVGDLARVERYLKEMKTKAIVALGTTPVAACQTADHKKEVQRMLKAELKTRGIV